MKYMINIKAMNVTPCTTHMLFASENAAVILPVAQEHKQSLASRLCKKEPLFEALSVGKGPFRAALRVIKT